MKKLITITIVLVLTLSVNAQNKDTYTCPEGFGVEKLSEFPPELDKLRPTLVKLRAWARKNNQAQAELVTNRLEYWAKDMARYIRNYSETHTDKVCERLLEKDLIYLNDFFILTLPLLDYQYPNAIDRFNAIDMTKYK